MKKTKISELPLYQSLKGLFTLGTDAQNRSVKVSLEFVENDTRAAVEYARGQADTLVGTTRQTLSQMTQQANTDVANAVGRADTATAKANEAAARALTTRSEILAAIQRLVPTGLAVKCLSRLTLGNSRPVFIEADLTPTDAIKNIIFIGDHRAIEVGTDGRISPVAVGKSVIHVIPTCNTSLAKTIIVEVGNPVARLASSRSRLRLTSSGAFRLA